MIAGDYIMPAFCPNCWKELPSGKEICPTCGQKVTLGPYEGKYRPWSLTWDKAFDGLVAGMIAMFVVAVAIIAVLWFFML
jgi:hypothetical protein